MTDKLKKYLIIKYTQGGHPDKSVGNNGEIQEYGRDGEHAIERVKSKRGTNGYYQVIGEIQ